MPYLYFGKTSLYKGKPLFKILCNLKDFGRGRIVYRTIDYYDHPDEISFFKILYAQPQMDEKTWHGRVVAERIYRSRRFKEPVILSSVAYKPDFRLVPKDEEEDFCQWANIKDYDKSVDAPVKAKWAEMPPLMKEVIRRNRLRRGESVNEEDFRLPAHKIYTGDHNIEDEVESCDVGNYLTEEFATHKNFEMEVLPEKWWLDRFESYAGRKKWSGYMEGKEWDEQKKRLDEETRLKERMQQLGLNSQ